MTQKELNELLGDMSLEEKIGQLVQVPGSCYEENAVITGEMNNGWREETCRLAGSTLGIYGAKKLKKIQDEYMRTQPHHIPLLFMLDVIHGFPVQYTYFAINAILLVVSLKVLGFKFSLKTIFGVLTLTFFLSLIQKVTAGVTLLHDQPFMACVLGASFCGSGIGIAFSANGSTGGTDIIAAVINKYRDITLGRVMLICDLIIISSSYFILKDWEKVVYGYVTLYVCSFVLDQVVNSARQSVQFFIISTKYEEIGRQINEYPHRGVTIINATGFYTGKEQKMMFILAKKRESTIIFRIIKDIDPNAFVSQSAVIGVYGEGFDHIKVK